ncbi:hypothetical protein EN759_00390 [Mesorhizobium sp. M00.F.Ca.ET.038.03.1.1]|nr:hypothetical protein EN759_00390 [Mesorhizobium sp. M00.F.Ca.ET.038.03.1.1]TIW02788.1 MAG: hypothetical protein E5V77_05145 [Mesorhizobium sp.]
MSGCPTIHIRISAKVDPLLRLRAPFTGDQEQMLADMRRVEALRRDRLEGVIATLSRSFVSRMRHA